MAEEKPVEIPGVEIRDYDFQKDELKTGLGASMTKAEAEARAHTLMLIQREEKERKARAIEFKEERKAARFDRRSRSPSKARLHPRAERPERSTAPPPTPAPTPAPQPERKIEVEFPEGTPEELQRDPEYIRFLSNPSQKICFRLRPSEPLVKPEVSAVAAGGLALKQVVEEGLSAAPKD